MRISTGAARLAAFVISVGVAMSASAVPITYNLELGYITTIQLQDVGAPITPTSCPVGSGSCLVGGPLQLTSATVTVDLESGELLNLSIFVAGPGIIDMNGLNGYEAVVFNNTSFQSSGATTLTPSGSQFNFTSPGLLSAGSVELFLAGNPGPYPGPSPDYTLPYTNPTAPGGNFRIVDGQARLTLTGVDLGVFVDPLTGGNPVLAKADFSFTAAVPEPSAYAMYGAGLLVLGAALKRWMVPVS